MAKNPHLLTYCIGNATAVFRTDCANGRRNLRELDAKCVEIYSKLGSMAEIRGVNRNPKKPDRLRHAIHNLDHQPAAAQRLSNICSMFDGNCLAPSNDNRPFLDEGILPSSLEVAKLTRFW